jgi:hypothetical protein
VQTRTKGQKTFTNVSKELLYNNGLRNLQMRFYQVPTTVP